MASNGFLAPPTGGASGRAGYRRLTEDHRLTSRDPSPSRANGREALLKHGEYDAAALGSQKQYHNGPRPTRPPPTLLARLSSTFQESVASLLSNPVPQAAQTGVPGSLVMIGPGATEEAERAKKLEDMGEDQTLSSEHDGSALLEPQTPTVTPTATGGWKARLSKINPGLPLMVFNSLVSCFISMTVKALTSAPYSYATFQLVFIRSLVVSSYGLLWQVFAPRLGIKGATALPTLDLLIGPKGARKLLFARSVAGFISIATYYYCVRYLSVGEATVLSFTTPIFVGILGRIVLKEKWEKVDALASCIALFGVAVIAKPDILYVFAQSPTTSATAIRRAVRAAFTADSSVSPATRMMAIALGISSSMAGATVYIFLRKLRGAASSITISTVFALHSAWLSVLGAMIFDGNPLAVIKRVPTSAWEVVMLTCFMSTLGLMGQLILNIALRFETAAKCSMMNFCQVPFSFTVEYFVRNRIPALSDYVGASVIVSCVLLVTGSKLHRELMEARKAKETAAAAAVAAAHQPKPLPMSQPQKSVLADAARHAPDSAGQHHSRGISKGRRGRMDDQQRPLLVAEDRRPSGNV